jgi:hypothetical protein
MKLLLLFVATLLSARAEGQSFDLVCSGSSYDSTGGKQSMPKPYTSHLRIDLGRRLWCQEKCAEQIPIFAVSPGLLTLSGGPGEHITADAVLQTEHVINRVTGDELLRIDAGETQTTYLGSCEKRPFSGFPPMRTKF